MVRKYKRRACNGKGKGGRWEVFLPTAEQIAETCAEIQAGWTGGDEQKHIGVDCSYRTHRVETLEVADTDGHTKIKWLAT